MSRVPLPALNRIGHPVNNPRAATRDALLGGKIILDLGFNFHLPDYYYCLAFLWYAPELHLHPRRTCHNHHLRGSLLKKKKKTLF